MGERAGPGFRDRARPPRRAGELLHQRLARPRPAPPVLGGGLRHAGALRRRPADRARPGRADEEGIMTELTSTLTDDIDVPYPALLDTLHEQCAPGGLTASPTGYALATPARLPGAADGP